jgi:hypothetical protein
MGTYGTEPFASDNAEEFFDKVSTAFKRRDPKRHEMTMKPIREVNRLPLNAPRHRRCRSLPGQRGGPGRHFQTIASDHYELARAAIEVFLMGCDALRVQSFPKPILCRVADPMLIALLRMRSDKEWIRSWGYSSKRELTQRKVVASLDRQIRTFRKMMPYTLVLRRSIRKLKSGGELVTMEPVALRKGRA